ncbi:site-specific DNA-methyltransferase [Aliivibrio logei]|uniref:site-specific DNA-methyltransferase n=1 Tax=Aliivibrio logei TaxID=688 RepID=UPI0035C8C36E
MTIEKTMIEKISLDHPESKSADITEGNIQQLKQLFPDVFSEGKIDFEALKTALGEAVDDRDERYNFTWNGKNQARQIAQTPSTGTLRPCKEDSVNWDSTENLFIEGDNLEVLKLLQKSYHKKVKMIYIDPPYNTGKDFVYKDNFHDNIKNYLELTEQVDGSGKKLSTNSDTSGRYHSDWLSMMYPRLKLARNLLTEDGVILISIDDNEYSNLKLLCDEVFGESNFMGCFIWEGGRKNDARRLSVVHDYILVYAKNDEYLKELGVKWKDRKEGLDEVYKKAKELTGKHQGNFDDASKELNKWFKSLPYGNPAKEHAHYKSLDEKGLYYGDNISSPNYRENLIFEWKGYKSPKNGWRYNLDAMKRLDEQGLLIYPESKEKRIQYKRYLHNTELWTPSTHFYKDRRSASKSLATLMGGNVFDFPKDINVLERLIKIFAKDDDIIMDFFAGSGSTGHAVQECNVKNSMGLKYILVQIPQVILDSKNNEAAIELCEALNVPNTISELTKERLRRCIGERDDHIYGFKILRLDDTNICRWDADFENLEPALQLAAKSIKDGRTSEDVLYEILLKYGLELTETVEETLVEGKKVFVVGDGALMVCLDDGISEAVVEGIAKLKQELDTEITQVVFKDQGFADSVVKTNAIQILKQYDIDDVKSI